jgi:hypothetical protein
VKEETMKPTRGALWTGAVALAWLWTGSAHAGWDNVFQVTCWHCKKKQPAVASYYYAQPAAPACGSCAPQPTCTTNYVQRCYYQPVTRYETRSYYEPVTTYRTSYYYEPVTTVRYSCYYDPCTCNYQQVATPTTSYRLREQCCPVQSWVQRCTSVPVTAYQQSFYWEPVTSCCTPAPVVANYPAPSCCGAPAAAATLSPAPAVAPAVGEQFRPTTPGVNEYPPRTNSDGYQQQRTYPPQQTSPPPVNNSSLRQPLPNIPTTQPAPARVRLDRIVALPDGAGESNAALTGVHLRLASEDRVLAQR